MIAAEALRTVWAKTVERRKPKRGELNSTAFLFWGCLVILGLEQEIRILGFEPTAASEQRNWQSLGLSLLEEGLEHAVNFVLKTFIEFWG